MSKDIGSLTKGAFNARIQTDIIFHKKEMLRLRRLQKDIIFYGKMYKLKYYIDLTTNQVEYKISNYDKRNTK